MFSKQRNVCQEPYHPNLQFWIALNILALFAVKRDGDLMMGNEYILGILCTEKSRYSTDADVIYMLSILMDGKSSPQ